MRQIYISSSWKQRDRVRALAIQLREAGFTVYDFTDPTCRQTPEIPPEKFPTQYDGESSYAKYIQAVPEWRSAVECNRRAIDECIITLLLLPCGLDAHADWAYAVGRGKLTAVVGHPPAGERTPTHMWADTLLDTDAEAVAWCQQQLDHPTAVTARRKIDSATWEAFGRKERGED